jgi:transposase-like protein
MGRRVSEPIPIRKRRNYTKRDRAKVVGASEVMGIRPAARDAGVPESTIRHWRAMPEMAQLRAEKKDEVAADTWATFQLGVRRVAELIPQTEDVQRVATAAAIMFDKFALMMGQATDRVETRDVTATLPDDELEAVTTSISEWLKARRALPDGA